VSPPEILKLDGFVAWFGWRPYRYHWSVRLHGRYHESGWTFTRRAAERAVRKAKAER